MHASKSSLGNDIAKSFSQGGWESSVRVAGKAQSGWLGRLSQGG
ncbi:hypothetical protein HanXRQr2_Chr06g0270441 [Helianthus annuus]|uniref:Uncharacterized protein n=1 Tax=Helianthus annuus TaxID=4232 RepID=A0A9K3NL17_HELAN|nr:hypothetical protein HanXRQr2_Chr06g0270441 [Helianthus annuus]KAJ0916381.1 hypothetical protein HanPSC8_Chr06g0261021 [Helianthus annuus]